MGIMDWFMKPLEERITRKVMAVVLENDDTIMIGGRGLTSSDRDRYDYNRQEVLEQALDAWRVNPLARRIVELTTQYVVGGGLRVGSDDEQVHAFLQEFWGHPLNQMPIRINEWCDELTRSGELFLVISTDAQGMSYCRAVPAADIAEISTKENDILQEMAYTLKDNLQGEGPRTWQGRQAEIERGEDGAFRSIMLHYAINRPVGAVHGESDLAPLLRWLSRYAGWLEDRARLNRYRNTFLFTVRAKFANEAERIARQNALTANPPSPGSILVTDESEAWSVLAPQLGSQEAAEDGLALKKMIAAGAGLPLHYLAEPESSTRTTAEAAGGPTYRHFEQRQKFMLAMLEDLLRVVVQRRGLIDVGLNVKAKIMAAGADLSARDNAALAVAGSTVVAALGDLRDRGIIDDAELLRMAYRFTGEVVDLEQVLANGRKAGPIKRPGKVEVVEEPSSKGAKAPPVKIGPDGEAKGVAEI